MGQQLAPATDIAVYSDLLKTVADVSEISFARYVSKRKIRWESTQLAHHKKTITTSGKIMIN